MLTLRILWLKYSQLTSLLKLYIPFLCSDCAGRFKTLSVVLLLRWHDLCGAKEVFSRLEFLRNCPFWFSILFSIIIENCDIQGYRNSCASRQSDYGWGLQKICTHLSAVERTGSAHFETCEATLLLAFQSQQFQPLPKYTSQVVHRFVRPMCQPYTDLMSVYGTFSTEKFRRALLKHHDLLNRVTLARICSQKIDSPGFPGQQLRSGEAGAGVDQQAQHPEADQRETREGLVRFGCSANEGVVSDVHHAQPGRRGQPVQPGVGLRGREVPGLDGACLRALVAACAAANADRRVGNFRSTSRKSSPRSTSATAWSTSTTAPSSSTRPPCCAPSATTWAARFAPLALGKCGASQLAASLRINGEVERLDAELNLVPQYVQKMAKVRRAGCSQPDAPPCLCCSRPPRPAGCTRTRVWASAPDPAPAPKSTRRRSAASEPAAFSVDCKLFACNLLNLFCAFWFPPWLNKLSLRLWTSWFDFDQKNEQMSRTMVKKCK